MRNSFTITARKDEVLKTLQSNLEKHSGIVAEAREGFVRKAEAALTKKLVLLREGKLSELSVHLTTPKDFTKEYVTAITMLQMHVGDTIDLTQDLVRCYIQDEWDWDRDFLLSNSGYSKTATAVGLSKYGVSSLED